MNFSNTGITYAFPVSYWNNERPAKLSCFFFRNEEGEEHLLQRRRQLPFNLSTGEGSLYNTWMESFSVSGPPNPATSSASEPGAEDRLDPASVLGSLHRQDHSVYSCTPKAGPQSLPPVTETLDLEHPQSSLEQAFWDSHALLSVPGQTQTSEETPVTGDLMADAMMESLEQIMGDIENGGMEGFEIEEAELRDWENTLVRKNNERQDVLNDLNQVLANDVFSYVEEALMRETGGLLQGSHTPAPAHSPQLWPRCGEQLITSQPCSFPLPDSTPPSWRLPVGNGNGFDQRAQHKIAHRLQGSSPCRHQPPPQSFHCHTLTPALRGPGSLNSAAPPHRPQKQQLPGSCGYGNREGYPGNAGAAAATAAPVVGVNGTVPAHMCSRGQPLAAHPNAPFPLSQPHTAAYTDVETINSLHLNGDMSGLDVSPEDCCVINASLQSSVDCWQEEAQVT